MMRVYIAGPITGHDLDERRATFAAAADALRLAGHEPVNPFEVAPTTPGWGWIDYMRADLAALLTCDGLAHLPGWENSDGAIIEVNLARRLAHDVRPLRRWVHRSRVRRCEYADDVNRRWVAYCRGDDCGWDDIADTHADALAWADAHARTGGAS